MTESMNKSVKRATEDHYDAAEWICAVCGLVSIVLNEQISVEDALYGLDPSLREALLDGNAASYWLESCYEQVIDALAQVEWIADD